MKMGKRKASTAASPRPPKAALPEEPGPLEFTRVLGNPPTHWPNRALGRWRLAFGPSPRPPSRPPSSTNSSSGVAPRGPSWPGSWKQRHTLVCNRLWDWRLAWEAGLEGRWTKRVTPTGGPRPGTRPCSWPRGPGEPLACPDACGLTWERPAATCTPSTASTSA